MACFSGGSYKEDVNIGNYNFLPIEIKINRKRPFQILDAFGGYLPDQLDQQKRYAQKKLDDEERKQKQNEEEWIHPKVKEANAELAQRKEYLAQISGEVDSLKQQADILMDMIIAQQMDQDVLESKMAQIEDKRQFVLLERQIQAT